MIYRYSLILCSSVLLTSCFALRAYKYRNLNLEDNARMPSVPIQKGDSTSAFIAANTAADYQTLKQVLDSQLHDTHTAAFLVVRNDSIIYENYFNGFNGQSLLPSFSVSKSFTSVLIGIALDEGKITSTQDPVTKYIPELARRDARFNKITLQHLLDMRSGIYWREGSYNLKDDAIQMAFSLNVMRRVRKLRIEREPGGDFAYKSINTQLLGVVLERATGKKVSQYLQEKIWKPVGMESNGAWTVDSKKHKHELVFGGLNATARDYAKLGQLMINNGRWKGRPIVSESWVNASVSLDSLRQYHGYHNQWWAVRGEAFQATGILGQFVYVNPAKRLVIVRLGHHWKSPRFAYANGFIATLGNEL